MDQLERLTLNILMLFTIKDFVCAWELFEQLIVNMRNKNVIKPFGLKARKQFCFVCHIHRGDGAVIKSVRLASGMLGVRIPAATDLSRKNR